MELDPTQSAGPVGPQDPPDRAEHQMLFARVKANLFGPGGDEPVRIGRYVPIKRIGEGGMGLIYAAYDDALDRRVAVKLLHPRRVGAGSQGRARLLREAQALARLSHPSVIHVYEVGTWEEQVYVAMEYVDGSTLQRWQHNRSWREVLDAYRRAGQGLQAAHEAGIVHRDFKADNVLVRDGDGSVRVVDFGLARTELEGFEVDLDSTAAVAIAADAPLTHTGAVMGTPAYMAPEQHAGGKADYRTDQFSFCVSLFEGLYGYRPFAGQTLAELRERVTAGQVEPAPRYTEVPPRIHQAMLRGLSVDPARRYPSMSALLADLADAAPRRRWRWAMAGAAGIVAGAGMLAWPTDPPDAAVLAERDRLTAMFADAGRQDAEEELRALRNRTTVEQWDDLVLSYARQRVDDAPTQALAALKHLSTDDDHWLGAARVLAAGALMRGPVRERLEGIEGASVLEFSSDASVLGIVDARGNASLWGVSGGYQTLELSTRAEGSLSVRDLAVGPGKEPTVWLVADDGALWRWADGAAQRQVKLGSGQLRSIALAPTASPQGHPRLAVSDATGVVFVVDAAEDPVVRELRDHRSSVGALAFGPKGIKLASGSDDGAIRLWFLDRQTHRSVEAAGAVSRLRFTEHGEAIAAQTVDGTLQQWTIEGVRRSRALDASLAWDIDSSGTRQVRFDEDGLRLRVDQDAGIEYRYLDTTGTRPSLVSIDPAGRVIAAATDRALLLWRAGPKPGERPADGHVRYSTGYGVRDLRFTPAGTLVSLDQSGRLLHWNDDGTSAPAIDSPERFEAMALDPEASRIALASSDRTLWVGTLGEEAEPVGTLHGLSTPRLQWSPDGAWVSATTCDVRDCALDMVAVDGSVQWGIDLHGRRARVRFSPDASSMMVEHDYGVWVRPLGPDASGEGRVVRLPVPAEHPRIAWSFAAETIRVVTSSSERPGPADLSVWMIGQGSRAHEVLSMPNLSHWVASEDGQNILLQTQDQRTLLWRLSRDRMIPLLRPPGTVRALSVSPDEKTLLVYTDTDPRPALIDVASGEHRWLTSVTGVQAWAPDGALAIGAMDIRLFSDPTPRESVDFLAWLDAATSVTMEPEGFR